MIPSKRQHLMLGSTSHLFPGHPPLFDYQPSASHSEPYSSLLDKVRAVLLN